MKWSCVSCCYYVGVCGKKLLLSYPAQVNFSVSVFTIEIACFDLVGVITSYYSEVESSSFDVERNIT